MSKQLLLWSQGADRPGTFKCEYDAAHNRVFISAECGAFSWCTGLNAEEAHALGVALQRGAFSVEAATPRVEDKP